MNALGIRGLMSATTLLMNQVLMLVRAFAGRRLPEVGKQERGDVPGWVMITLMSAMLVAALLALATPALQGLFNQAMTKVGK